MRITTMTLIGWMLVFIGLALVLYALIPAFVFANFWPCPFGGK